MLGMYKKTLLTRLDQQFVGSPFRTGTPLIETEKTTVENNNVETLASWLFILYIH